MTEGTYLDKPEGANLDRTNQYPALGITLKDLAMIFVSWYIVANAVVGICQAIILTVENVQ